MKDPKDAVEDGAVVVERMPQVAVMGPVRQVRLNPSPLLISEFVAMHRGTSCSITLFLRSTPPDGLSNRAYSHFRGYLHSRRLRWSYGALRGRETEAWQSLLAPLPPGELVDSLIAAQFAGIYVDRKGHEASAEALVAGLLRKVPQEPVTNGDGSLVFIRLPARQEAVTSLGRSLEPSKGPRR